MAPRTASARHAVCTAGSMSTSGSSIPGSDQDGDRPGGSRAVAVIVCPIHGPIASVRHTAAAAGASHAIASQSDPGRVSPTMTVSGAEAQNAGGADHQQPDGGVRRRGHQLVCRVGVSAERGAATPASGASGAIRRNVTRPSLSPWVFASAAKPVAQIRPTSQAPCIAGTETRSRAVSPETPIQVCSRSTGPGAGASRSAHPLPHVVQKRPREESADGVPALRKHVIRWVLTEAPEMGSTVPAAKAASASSSGMRQVVKAKRSCQLLSRRARARISLVLTAACGDSAATWRLPGSSVRPARSPGGCGQARGDSSQRRADVGVLDGEHQLFLGSHIHCLVIEQRRPERDTASPAAKAGHQPLWHPPEPARDLSFTPVSLGALPGSDEGVLQGVGDSIAFVHRPARRAAIQAACRSYSLRSASESASDMARTSSRSEGLLVTHTKTVAVPTPSGSRRGHVFGTERAPNGPVGVNRCNASVSRSRR